MFVCSSYEKRKLKKETQICDFSCLKINILLRHWHEFDTKLETPYPSPGAFNIARR